MGRIRRVSLYLVLIWLVACGGETAVLTPTSITPTPSLVPTTPPTPTATSAPPTSTPAPCATVEEPIRLLALGDSYTVGTNVEPEQNYPAQLVDVLTQQGVQVEEMTIRAQAGWTTTDLLDSLTTQPLTQTYDLTLLLIGVNNQFRGLSLDGYRTDLIALHDLAYRSTNRQADHVLILSIPDWGVTSFANRMDREAISHQIHAFNAINEAEAVWHGTHYVDLVALSQLAGTQSTLTSDDRLHPSAEMYGLWVQQLLPVVCQALTESGN